MGRDDDASRNGGKQRPLLLVCPEAEVAVSIHLALAVMAPSRSILQRRKLDLESSSPERVVMLLWWGHPGPRAANGEKLAPFPQHPRDLGV